VHDVFCRNLCAYLQRLFELVGAKDVTVRHVACRTRGDAECEFVFRWR
jgi:predicted hydrocarbon binding protein